MSHYCELVIKRHYKKVIIELLVVGNIFAQWKVYKCRRDSPENIFRNPSIRPCSLARNYYSRVIGNTAFKRFFVFLFTKWKAREGNDLGDLSPYVILFSRWHLRVFITILPIYPNYFITKYNNIAPSYVLMCTSLDIMWYFELTFY